MDNGAIFFPHSLHDYNPSLHAFPGLSANVSINVTKLKYVIVENKKYKVYKYVWFSSIIGNRYIGAFLPYFKSNKKINVGVIIYDDKNNPVSCITGFNENLYVISGIGYETLDVDVSNGINVIHHVLKDGNSIYGSNQNIYDVIKQIAQEKSIIKSNNIVKYNIWIGSSISQITAVDDNDKEIMRTRIKHGGYIVK
ncbi:schlafen-like protein [Hypsugopox virus]|nr:schlafen-like protein [Hypsugopox virus]